MGERLTPRPPRDAPAWRRYLRFWGGDPKRDLDDELHFHLQARYDEYVAAGMDAQQAHAEVEHRFGDVRAVRDACATIDSQWEREQNLMDALHATLADLRYAARQLRRNPSLTVAAVLCFALGIGANTAIFSVVDGVLFRPLPFRDADRIVLVGEGLPRLGPDNFGQISAPEVGDYERLRGHTFSDLAIYEGTAITIPDRENPERATALRATWDLFGTLGVSPALGRAFVPADDSAGHPAVMILSDALWRSRFNADPHVLGWSIVLDGTPTTVVGVMPPGFRFPLPRVGGQPVDAFLPLVLEPSLEGERGNSYNAFLIARLAPGVTLAGAKRAVNDIATNLPRFHPAFYHRDWPTVADAFALRDYSVQDARRPLLILLAAVGLVLLIACINVSSLLLARAAAREREIAVRQALGASRGQLVRQFLAESALLVVAGSALGMVVAVWGAQLIATHGPSDVLSGYDASIDMRVLAVTAAVAIVTAVLFSLVPAFGRPLGSLGAALRDEGRGTTAGRLKQRGRRGLVVAEVSLALVLATAAGLMVRSFMQARRVDPGFDPSHVATFLTWLPPTRYPTVDDIRRTQERQLDALRALPGVRAASATNNLPMDQEIRAIFSVEGAPTPDKVPVAWLELVYPDYFGVLGITLMAGRGFRAGDRNGTLPVAVVNETLADRYMGGVAHAIGRRIKWGSAGSPNPWVTVVGVARDVKVRAPDQPVEPATYYPALQADSGAAVGLLRTVSYVVRTADDPAPLLPTLRHAVRTVDPTLPVVHLRPMTEVVDLSIADRRFNTFLLGAFALVALTLASIGIYGLIAYSVVQRTREMGVRLAIGATPADVVRLVVGQGARLAAVGVAIGLAGALLTTRVMSTLLFDVNPFDPASFAFAAALLLFVAVVASLLPAWRASRTDPQVAIRSD